MTDIPEGRPLQEHDVMPARLTRKDEPVVLKGPIDMGLFLHLTRTKQKVTVT